ncbi:MAG: alanine--tRNA ligase [Brevinema sp.]
MLKSSQTIRQEFINFFKNKAHTIVPSASLIPENDQTLLFTNAGMNQFKDVFLGTGTRPYTRAVDTQKVMRVSGKHNDFDDVGRDTYHHTFFEMLGNWSFGDYYKKEAISWAWELLTDTWKLPKERLYATVHHSDQESLDIWKELTDINPDHILKFGDKENFWEMGAVGPCGPCSEIHIDLSPNLQQSIGAEGINADNPLFIELWNLVFIQYKRQEDGSLQNLPAKHVDTGMGFERITAVLQHKTSNYDTDLFTPIIDFLCQDSGKPYHTDIHGTPHRVIADHIRALTFAIGDGIIPSNEGRGYVIRKILRRAVRFGKELGYIDAFLYKLVPIIAQIMEDIFPEIKERQSSIQSVIRSEEESFFRTLNKGFDKIKELITLTKARHITTVSGDDVFLLYDSLGFPVDFTEQILKDEDLDFDKIRFEELMQAQKERARSSWKGEGINFSVFGNIPKSTYIESEQLESMILGLAKDSQNIKECQAGDDIILVLDKTPFYGEKGGQIGDTGLIKNGEDHLIEIFDTKIFEEKYIHIGKVLKGSFNVGQQITAVVNNERKKDIARHHSAAHLLFKALRTVLGDHIGQAGSWVGENRTRIDFTHPQAISKDDLQKITNLVNQDIIANHQTFIEELPINEAKAQGAIAAFEEKYGDLVRVVHLGESIELCGGTHVSYTGELGFLTIIDESSVSAGTRRIEALTGKAALEYITTILEREKKIAHNLKCSGQEILEKIHRVLEDSKQKDKEIKQIHTKIAENLFESLNNSAKIINDYRVIIASVEPDQLQEISSLFKNRIQSGVLILGSYQSSDNSALLSVVVTKDLTSIIPAGQLLKQLLPMIDGKGGGKDDQAMGGGKNGVALTKTLDQALEIITDTLLT